jgi:hypothetical protein
MKRQTTAREESFSEVTDIAILQYGQTNEALPVVWRSHVTRYRGLQSRVSQCNQRAHSGVIWVTGQARAGVANRSFSEWQSGDKAPEQVHGSETETQSPHKTKSQANVQLQL